MGFGVFIHRSDSIYDDTPAERYHFPRQYLGRVEACVGDWILYYEPRKVAGTRGYFAVAKVREIIPDRRNKGMYFALIESGSYLDFSSPVPFSGRDGIAERGLVNQRGGISGRAQSAVRPVSPQDFNRIISLGLSQEPRPLPRIGHEPISDAVQDERLAFQFEEDRDRIAYITSRVVRDRVFRTVVLRAYGERCAITGLRLINGGGRAEVEAAHIRPVEANGPDTIRNGIALSGTIHWMFDRGLISLSDDLEILLSRQLNDQDGVRGLINETGRALAPNRQADRPHPHFLQWHRENCFKY